MKLDNCSLVKPNVSETLTLQKQQSRGALRKRCSENKHQIYRRTPIPNCDFNTAWVFSYKFAAYVQNTTKTDTPVPCSENGNDIT